MKPLKLQKKRRIPLLSTISIQSFKKATPQLYSLNKFSQSLQPIIESSEDKGILTFKKIEILSYEIPSNQPKEIIYKSLFPTESETEILEFGF
ncbi:hypothetical protein SS50377_26125 [Spironucleus salmonicida]|uniref:Uncharacterized protein n=1 Tax=Spironucleus salmonicida TaxID=348837 RepID=V6LRK9_9EUKA|nr:hypothetical protein SS50377_26125 [Spironucleus salmonicida]|eukprot:EST46331.1 Hypothetical protein SS50377_13642 [Spironucleus salmonicida]